MKLVLPLIFLAGLSLNPDFALAKSARRAATHLFGASGVNPAIGGTIPQVTPPKAESQRDAACEFCLSAEQAGNSIAKFGLKLGAEEQKEVYAVTGATAKSAGGPGTENAVQGKKILVVYYSRTGNTRKVSEDLAKRLGADIEGITDLRKRSGFWGYMKAARDAMKKKTTEIGETVKNPAEYDLIIAGTPIWAGKMAPAVRTYLMKFSVSIKSAAFFTTAGGSSPEKTLAGMKEIIGKDPVATASFLEKELKDEKIYSDKLTAFIESVVKVSK